MRREVGWNRWSGGCLFTRPLFCSLSVFGFTQFECFMMSQIWQIISTNYSILQVEVSSPNADSENTLCTNSILGQPMCSTKVQTSEVTDPSPFAETTNTQHLHHQTTSGQATDKIMSKSDEGEHLFSNMQKLFRLLTKFKKILLCWIKLD